MSRCPIPECPRPTPNDLALLCLGEVTEAPTRLVGTSTNGRVARVAWLDDREFWTHTYKTPPAIRRSPENDIGSRIIVTSRPAESSCV